MKRLFIITLLIVAISSATLQAQLLWKITAPGSSSTSYLFGTHHTTALTLDNLPKVKDAISAVSEVYGEIDMQSMNSPEAALKLQQKTLAPADSTLSHVFTPAELKEIDTALARYSGGMLSTKALDQFVPAFVSTVLTMTVNAQAIPGFNPARQIDTDIQTLARSLGKTVCGLETVEFQTSVLFGIPIAQQAKDLLNALRNGSDMFAQATALNNAYIAGNIDALYEKVNEGPDAMDRNTRERLIDSRNHTWVEILCGILPAASIMIVVGAAHLPGSDGVISLLRDRGFKVEPVE